MPPADKELLITFELIFLAMSVKFFNSISNLKSGLSVPNFSIESAYDIFSKAESTLISLSTDRIRSIYKLSTACITSS